jgi:hypothetical protein
MLTVGVSSWANADPSGSVSTHPSNGLRQPDLQRIANVHSLKLGLCGLPCMVHKYLVRLKYLPSSLDQRS